MPKIKHPQHRSCFSCIYEGEILRPFKMNHACPFYFSSQFPKLNHILQSGHSSPGLGRNRILNLPAQFRSNTISVGSNDRELETLKHQRTHKSRNQDNPIVLVWEHACEYAKTHPRPNFSFSQPPR